MSLYQVISVNGGEWCQCSLQNKYGRSHKISRGTFHHIEPPQPTVTKSSWLLEDNGIVLFHYKNGENALADWSDQKYNVKKLQGASTFLW